MNKEYSKTKYDDSLLENVQIKLILWNDPNLHMYTDYLKKRLEIWFDRCQKITAGYLIALYDTEIIGILTFIPINIRMNGEYFNSRFADQKYFDEMTGIVNISNLFVDEKWRKIGIISLFVKHIIELQDIFGITTSYQSTNFPLYMHSEKIFFIKIEEQIICENLQKHSCIEKINILVDKMGNKNIVVKFTPLWLSIFDFFSDQDETFLLMSSSTHVHFIIGDVDKAVKNISNKYVYLKDNVKYEHLPHKFIEIRYISCYNQLKYGPFDLPIM